MPRNCLLIVVRHLLLCQECSSRVVGQVLGPSHTLVCVPTQAFVTRVTWAPLCPCFPNCKWECKHWPLELCEVSGIPEHAVSHLGLSLELWREGLSGCRPLPRPHCPIPSHYSQPPLLLLHASLLLWGLWSFACFADGAL